MRVTLLFLIALAAIAFVAAFVVATLPPPVDHGAIIAPGVVVALADGPHHAIVAVTPRRGSPFTFPANTQAGLKAGQRVTVRYEPGEPVATAEVVGKSADGSGALVWSLVLVGMLLVAAVGLSPALVRWFPDTFAPRIRP